LSKKVPGFEYRSDPVCVRKGLFGNCKEEVESIEYYDITDPAVRDQLINMRFVLRVRQKWGTK